MLSLLKSIKEALLDLFFPPFCVGCSQFGCFICPACLDNIDFVTLPFWSDIPNFSLKKVAVMAHYKPPINKLITSYKYKKAKILANTIVELIWERATVPHADYITFVPLHSKKIRLRGFNQTQLIADGLAKKMNLVCLDIFLKNHHHRPQAETKSKNERLNNLSESFSLRSDWLNNFDKNKIPKSILVIDDVITTGSTMHELGKLLKKNGVKDVYGFALAHD